VARIAPPRHAQTEHAGVLDRRWAVTAEAGFASNIRHVVDHRTQLFLAQLLFRPCIAFMLTQQITGGVPAQSESTIKKARQRRLCGVKFELESVITA
jgi:hypothetical protein